MANFPCDIRDIIIIMLILGMVFLCYKINKINNVERFTVTDDIKQAINDIYIADINAIRNLSDFATDIKNASDSFTIPAKTTKLTDLVSNGNITATGNLTINGKVTFANRNETDLMEIFPRYMIIAWALNEIPKGWAMCDGLKYILNANGIAERNDSIGFQTPKLTGRFVLGGGSDTGLSLRVPGQKGGREKITLTIKELPKHRHNFGRDYWDDGKDKYKGVDLGNYLNQWSNDLSGETTEAGQGLPFDNMPPFYVLWYIMKL